MFSTMQGIQISSQVKKTVYELRSSLHSSDIFLFALSFEIRLEGYDYTEVYRKSRTNEIMSNFPHLVQSYIQNKPSKG